MADPSREPLRKWIHRSLSEPLDPVDPLLGEDGDGDFRSLLLKQREESGNYAFGMFFHFDPDRFEAPGAQAELEKEILDGIDDLLRSIKRGRALLKEAQGT
jgi:hypothetical protein